MAKESIVRMTDDLGDGLADTTLQFGVNGVNYEIDLSKRNAKAFNEAIATYVSAGRRVSGPGRRSATKGAQRRSTTASAGDAKLDLAAIRHWAAQAGHKVADRGRISATVVEAFRAAQNATAMLSSAAPDVTAVGPKPVSTPRKSAVKRAPVKKTGARKLPAKAATTEPEAPAPVSA